MQPCASNRRVRTLFISDVHLGMRDMRIDALIDCLTKIEAETIYLVGDIVDGWRLRKSWYWAQSYNALVQMLIEKSRAGTRIVYLPGNHDEFLRDHIGTVLGDVEVIDRAIHIGADGKTYLVLHGDQFDVVVRHARWLAHIGDWAYNASLRANGLINWGRRRLGLPYWSLSGWAKRNVKNAASYIGRFEEALCHDARQAGVDGVVCGHIHHAVIHDRFGVTYLNCGDWVESCTAIVEDFNGRFELLRWPSTLPAQPRRRIKRRPTPIDIPQQISLRS